MAKAKLSQNDILNKEFKKAMNGYNKDEVDVFLDVIIKDYEAFRTEIDTLQAENEKLKALLHESKKRMEEVRHTSPQPNEGAVSLDILKRISNLEIAVFGGKRNNQ